MSAFPPQRSLTSIPVSQDVALNHIQNYLAATKEHKYLLPHARLEPTGPTASSGQGNITIHNLERVEAGLKGEWLAPILDLEEGGGVEVATGIDDPQGDGDQMNVDGWQELEEYQLEQEVNVGDVAPHQTVVAQEGDGLPVGAAEEVESLNRIEEHVVAPPKVDKEARKAAKAKREKERKKAEQEKKKAGAIP